MTRLMLSVCLCLLALLPVQAFAGPVEDASAVIDHWAVVFNANDAEAVVKLYAPDALLHGTSSPKLNVGTDAIREYFKGLPGSGNTVTIGERHMVALSDTAVMGVGFYQFSRPTVRPARFTFVIVKRGNDWVIAHHHSSALPPPPQ
jgi:uncharacterized protein (TIGR02246 family)